MSQIFGHLNVSDSERVMNTTVGQKVLYEAVQAYLDQLNADLAAASAVFVQEETDIYKERYKLPAGGYLQRRGADGRFQAVKRYGQWDVAYPLEDFGASIAGNDVDMAYMTVRDLDTHILTVTTQNVNTVRFEMLKALLNNTQDTFVDQTGVGSLSIEPLANGDAVVYPPVLGSDTEATDTHYLESNYAYTAISSTNNPLVTMRKELEEHFGTPTGGSSIAIFCNAQETSYLEALPGFVSVFDRYTKPGDDSAVPQGLPAVPGRVLGRCNSVWVVEWRWLPAAYLVAVDIDAPAPLKKRVDPADTGLGRGLQLVAEDEEFPFQTSFWRNRFGFGCGNRLNGVVMELGTGGTYSIPSGYS